METTNYDWPAGQDGRVPYEEGIGTRRQRLGERGKLEQEEGGQASPLEMMAQDVLEEVPNATKVDFERERYELVNAPDFSCTD